MRNLERSLALFLLTLVALLAVSVSSMPRLNQHDIRATLLELNNRAPAVLE